MNLVHQLLAQRGARKLKSAGTLSAGALKHLQDDLVGLGASAVSPLTDCLSDGDARAPAMEVLEHVLNDETLEAFVDALSSGNPAIVSGVARVLGTSRRYDPTRLLAVLGDPTIPKSVLESILHEQGAALPIDKLLFVLPEINRDGQIVIFRLLDKRADPSVIPSLLPLLGHVDPQVRTSATKLLSRYADEQVVTGIRALVGDKVGTVRLESVQALQRLRAQSAVPDLVSALRDADFKVQAAAIDALCEIGDATAVPHLLSVLTDPSDSVRRAAVEVLNVVATPEAIQDLVRALGDQDWWVRVRAADALGALGGEKVVRAVVGLMSAEDEFTRRQAVEILNAVPTGDAVEALIAALDDPDWWVRERAIDALGKTRDPRAVAPLIQVMTRYDKTAPLCARALGAIGDPRALEPLVQLQESGPEEFQKEALEALKAFPTAELGVEGKNLLHQALSKAHERGASGAPPSPRSLGPEIAIPARPEGHAPLPVAPAPAAASPARPARDRVPTAPTIPNFTDLPTGLVLLDRFRILRKVGKGGFGVVYLVEDSAIQDQLILKILNPQFSIDETITRRFVQELKLTRRITHRNVIRIHDFLDLGGAHAVSMEYFPGKDLGALLQEGSSLDVRRSLHILCQVCDGLTAAHAVGVIHRDIKPGNILVGESDTAKILDFGLASSQQLADSRLTKSGVLIGSPEYMAPEQITGESIDHRADLYSLGIVMYEMFSGTKPFVAETPVKVLFQHLEGEAEPLGARVKELPAGIEHMVSLAMARDPASRPQSAEALRILIEKERESLGGSD